MNCLLIDAALAGGNYGSNARYANPREHIWTRHRRAILRALARRQSVQVLDAQYRFQLALLGNSSLSRESFDATQEQALTLCNAIAAGIQPWAEAARGRQRDAEARDYRQQFIEAVGADPTSAEFKAWEQEQIANWHERQQREQTEQDAAEARLQAALQARQRRRAN